jgi:hypothetical protein
MINLCIQNGFNWTQLLAPSIAVIAIEVAIVQLYINNKTCKADFTHKLDSDFFTDEAMIRYWDLIKFNLMN